MRVLPVLVLLVGIASVSPALAGNPCPDQPTHTYGAYASNGNGRALSSHGVAVGDTNSATCNAAGDRPLFDGDYDVGEGGAFFGYGTWAEDPDCDYELNVHGPNIAIQDAVFGRVPYVTGEDDQTGPFRLQDPVTGRWTCITDGFITPGDPATDPAADADDCLSPGETACGTGGGDGGFWVILVPGGNPPSVGTITAY